MATTLIGPSLPFMGQEFNTPLWMLGLLASLWNVGFLLTIPGGALSDRYGELALLSVSLPLIAIGLGFASTAPSYGALAGSLLLGGVGMALGGVSVNSLTVQLYPQKSGVSLNVLHLFYGVGCLMGPSFAGLLISRFGSWRLPYMVTSLVHIPLVVAAILSLRRFPGRLDSSPKSASQMRGMSQYLIFLGGLLLLAFLDVGAEQSVSAWLPSFLMLERKVTVEWSGLSVSLFWGSVAAGRVLLGRLVDRIGYRRAITAFSLAAATSILLGSLLEAESVILACWSLSGFFLGPVFPTVLAWATRTLPTRSGIASGMVLTLGFSGAIFSPWFIGLLSGVYTLRISILYLTISILLVGLFALKLSGRNLQARGT